MPEPRQDSGLDDAGCSPRVYFLPVPWQVPCRRPRDWAAPRSALRGAFRLGRPQILTALVAKPQRRGLHRVGNWGLLLPGAKRNPPTRPWDGSAA
jgi:hypothetical protein